VAVALVEEAEGVVVVDREEAEEEAAGVKLHGLLV
jgi:hypothetical protein